MRDHKLKAVKWRRENEGPQKYHGNGGGSLRGTKERGTTPVKMGRKEKERGYKREKEGKMEIERRKSPRVVSLAHEITSCLSPLTGSTCVASVRGVMSHAVRHCVSPLTGATHMLDVHLYSKSVLLLKINKKCDASRNKKENET